MFQKIFKFALQHKIAAVIIIFLAAVGGYYGYKAFSGSSVQVSYVSAAVEKGTLIISVSGSGQVSALNQVDIKSKASGEIIYVGANNGQEVKAGALLVKIDDTEALQTVWDAEANLQQAKVNLEKMKGLTTSEGNIRGNKEKALDDLEKAYEDGFNTVANAFLELPSIITGLNDMLFTSAIAGSNQWNIDYYVNAVRIYDEKVSQYRDDAYQFYQTARRAYDKNFSDYKSTSRFSDRSTIEALINETYDTTKDIAEAVKKTNNLIQFYKDKLTEHGLKPISLADTHLSNLNTYTGQTNSYLLNLLSLKTSIQSNKEAVINTNFDIADQEVKVKQAENTLSKAQENLANCYIYAPFSGVIAEMNVKKGDSVSSGTTLATLITKQKIAEITLNEIDVAKVKVGQKTTITFDAVEDLTITGGVTEVDTLGTVSQGVVNYGVKIGFDTQDERVKPGMSLSVAIITDLKQDALIIPNSAVKQEGNVSYVEIIEASFTTPQQQIVTTGLSNDTMTEITSGLKEGDKVITQTITSNSSPNQTQTNSSIRIPGLSGGGFGK